MTAVMLHIEDLRHRHGERTVLALDRLEAGADASLLVLGPSGSGKTTLLHIIAGLLRPTQGRIVVAGTDLRSLSAAALDRFRGRTIGFVPQRLHLVPSLDVTANVRLAAYMAGTTVSDARIAELLGALGITHRARAWPAQLSQGEAQRAAVARAVVNGPRLLLADEPTANLDDAAATQSIEVLEGGARACGALLVVATHDQRLKSRIARRVELGGNA